MDVKIHSFIYPKYLTSFSKNPHTFVYGFLEEPNDLDARVLVIFQLRWSDIFDKSKVILKLSVSVILYLPLNCAKHNITRRKPNITA